MLKIFLKNDLFWRVGKRDNVLTNEYAWVPKATNSHIQNIIINEDLYLVVNLIDNDNKKWKEDVIRNTVVVVDVD